MEEVTLIPSTEKRKADHIRINLEENVQFPRLSTQLERYYFMHEALPEMNLKEIDTELTIFGKPLTVPILISSMTGGTSIAQRINQNLARAANRMGIAMGLGSQRAMLEDRSLIESFYVRDVAPDILLFANMGVVQLNYGYEGTDFLRAAEQVDADALIIHCNALQEAVQPEGDHDFRGLLEKIRQLCRQSPIPIIAKEVGWGFSESTVHALVEAGVSAVDVAGAGGTSWSEVEYHRAPDDFHAKLAASFADWGIPTAEAISNARAAAPDLPIIASGGLRDGVELAKCIALGATMGGYASPFLRVADNSSDAVEALIQLIKRQLQVAMFCCGASNLEELSNKPLLKR